MASGAKVAPVRSSSPYQVLLFFNAWYAGFLLVCEALILIYKGEVLPYPQGWIGVEIALLVIYAFLEIVRIFNGMKGNLTEHVLAVGISLTISIASLFASLYLLLWQTYVLRVEAIINAIQLLFIGLEFIFGIISIITFSRAQVY